MPSGTMSNQIGVKVHTQPGDEMLCDVNCHIYTYEAGGPAVLSRVMCRTIERRIRHARRQPARGQDPAGQRSLVRTRLVCLENTHNRGGGRVYPLEKIRRSATGRARTAWPCTSTAPGSGTPSVATGIPARAGASASTPFRSVSARGWGRRSARLWRAPREFIARARRVRKLFGGGMRQGGVLAAACLYALENHIERLAEDHRNAQMIAQAIADTPGLKLDPPEVETNLIWFDVEPRLGTAKDVAARFREQGVLIGASGPQTMRRLYPPRCVDGPG